MLVCPSCESEYRAGISRCADCNLELLPPDQVAQAAAAYKSPKEGLKDLEKAYFPQPNLTACRELEKALLDAGIRCYTHVEEADADVALGSASSMLYAVVFAQDDLETVKGAMKERFAEMVESEGFGSFQTEAIDLEAETVECPACGHSGALTDDGECADCGLVLGAPE